MHNLHERIVTFEPPRVFPGVGEALRLQKLQHFLHQTRWLRETRAELFQCEDSSKNWSNAQKLELGNFTI